MLTVKAEFRGDEELYYGYARVSTKDQNEERQVIALKEFMTRECSSERYVILTDKESGKDFDRQNYRRIIRRIKRGDVFVVKSIDRLGRNYEESLEQWRVITKEKGAEIVVIDMPLLDTRKSRDLTGTLIADIVLQLLSYVSQNERESIRRRQAEGIAAAKARGVRFGREPIKRPETYEQVLSRYKNGDINATEAGKRLGVCRVTFTKWVKQDHQMLSEQN